MRNNSFFRLALLCCIIFALQATVAYADNHTFCDGIDNEIEPPLIFNESYYQAQVASYNEAISENPEDVELLTLRGDGYYALRMYAEAIADFSLASELDPESTYALARLGDSYQQIFAIESAIDIYTQAIELDTDYTYAYIKRGTAYRKLGESTEAALNANVYKLAMQDMNQAVRLDRNSALAYARRSELHLVLENTDLALQDAEFAVALGSDFTFSHVVLASIYKSRGNFRAASNIITDALNTPTDTPRSYAYALSMRGEMCWRLGARAQAITDLSTALDYDREFASTYIVLARVALDLGDDFDKIIARTIYNRFDEPSSFFATAIVRTLYGLVQDKPASLQYLQAARYNPINPFVYGQLKSLGVNPVAYQDSYLIFTSWLEFAKSLEDDIDSENSL